MNVTPDYFASPSDAGTLARLRLRLEQAAEAEGLLDVAYTTVDSPVGPLLLAATPKGLVRVAYDTEGPRPRPRRPVAAAQPARAARAEAA